MHIHFCTLKTPSTDVSFKFYALKYFSNVTQCSHSYNQCTRYFHALIKNSYVTQRIYSDYRKNNRESCLLKKQH